MSVIEIEPGSSVAADGVATSNFDERAEAELPRPRRTERLFGGQIKSIPFFLVHAGALLAFFVDFQWRWVALAIGLYYLRMFGLTAGYHRYFSHRSFKTSRAVQFLFAWLGAMCVQKGVLWWAAHHRAHHRFSDTEHDIHSPSRHGILWAHMGWILSPIYDETDFKRIADFARYPEIRWIDRWHLVPAISLFAALYLLWGLPGLVWGGFVSTTFLWHGTFTINSLSHVFGKVRYRTTDTSKNNWLLALITMGEGWHNNHHYYQASASQGFFWWEVDASYYLLCALEKLGLIWDVKRPPKAILEGNRVGAAAAAA